MYREKEKKNVVGVVALLIAIIALGYALAGSYQKASLDGTFGTITNGNFTRFTSVDTTEGYSVNGTTIFNGSGQLTLGSGGTALTLIAKGTCTMTSNGATVTATSTAYASCATTGSLAGDSVMVQLATSTLAIANNWALLGAQASTTASGSTEVKLMNLTGTGAAIPAAILGNVTYEVLR